MRRGSSLITTLLFLFHVVTECGSHHAHADDVSVSLEATCPTSASAYAPGAAPCGHHHGSGHNNCQSSQCVFVRTKSRNETEFERAVPRAERCSRCIYFQAALTSLSVATELNDTRRPPIRLHLQLQVLLV